ncbi:centlein isoform X6 [Pongo pygmaeus]|uniref:centlein isoform X8 n=1 Tax=Pongo abelii TaxID=9601 RepID=UPI000CEFEDC9|nr:centlein isoform X9 [Pongo abelii]XP_054357385.1 centlein isoform X3 [Pongo pygmaeus]
MAARSPPSRHPSPPARQLGPRSPRVGRGAEVHAVRSEASGFAGAAREVVADKSDKIWVGEEGSGGRRGPGGAAPAHAPLLSAPMGSRRLEGISVEEAMVTRTQLLEEELSSLKEELALCQADKEFVWALWKRLQVTNPDLTQVVSLVVERRPLEDVYHQNEEYTKKHKKLGLRKCEIQHMNNIKIFQGEDERRYRRLGSSSSQ